MRKKTPSTVAKRTKPKAESLPELDVTPVAEVDLHRSWVIYGRSGTGKTTFTSTFPKPMLYVNVRDNGTDSIRNVKGIDVYNVNDVDDLEELRLYMRKQKKYKTLVIDTMSQLQEVYVEEAHARKESKATRGKRAGEWGTMTKQDWGQIAGELKSFVLEMRDLPMEIVFIAQDRVFNMDDEDSGASELMPEIGPRLMPSVASVMNAAVMVIGQTLIRRKVIKKKSAKSNKTITSTKIVYCLRVGPSDLYMTKLRKPKETEAPDFIENPSYEDVVDLIEGDLD